MTAFGSLAVPGLPLPTLPKVLNRSTLAPSWPQSRLGGQPEASLVGVKALGGRRYLRSIGVFPGSDKIEK